VPLSATAERVLRDLRTAARYNEIASTVMRMLASASTELARIKASRRL
jgi:hypothetical protein